MSDRVCAVTGVGPGTGAALVRRFAAEGYRVAMLARSAERLEELARTIPAARAYAADVGNEAAVHDAFARIRSELGPVETLLYNAGSGVFASFIDTPPDAFEAAWRVNALGPAGFQSRGKNFFFELAMCHFFTPNKAASLRRARNSRSFILAGRRPSAVAIS